MVSRIYGELGPLNKLALIIFLGVWLVGCPKRIPTGSRQAIAPADLLALIARQEAQIFSVKGQARLQVDGPGGKGTVTLFVAVARPRWIHLESLGFFGQPQAILVSDGNTFGLFQAQESKYYRGPASPENISRFLPIVLPGHELVTILLGGAPRIAGEATALKALSDPAGYELKLTRGPVTQTLIVDAVDHRVLKSEVRGIDGYDLFFEDFERGVTPALPLKIRLAALAASTTLELRYQDLEINQKLDVSLFFQRPPAGVPIVDVDERGNPLVKDR
jgi:hypothetical protein